MTDDNVRQMLLLAERLKEQHGGELDDAAILAVAEATGATPEYVRLAVRLLPEKKHGLGHHVRATFLTLEPDTRRHVISGVLATLCALLSVLSRPDWEASNLFGTVLLILLGLAVWNIGVSKDTRAAAISGALFGGIYFVAEALFTFIAKLLLTAAIIGHALDSLMLIPFVLGAGVIGMITQRIVSRLQRRF